MLKRTKKIAVIASITLLCAFNACLATSSTDNDKEAKAVPRLVYACLEALYYAKSQKHDRESFTYVEEAQNALRAFGKRKLTPRCKAMWKSLELK